MSIRGRVTFECDSKRCHAECVIEAEDADLVNGKRTPEAVFQASGWVLDDEGDLHCESCVEESQNDRDRREDSHEREAERARNNDFADTFGRDWT